MPGAVQDVAFALHLNRRYEWEHGIGVCGEDDRGPAACALADAGHVQHVVSTDVCQSTLLHFRPHVLGVGLLLLGRRRKFRDANPFVDDCRRALIDRHNCLGGFRLFEHCGIEPIVLSRKEGREENCDNDRAALNHSDVVA